MEGGFPEAEAWTGRSLEVSAALFFASLLSSHRDQTRGISDDL